MKLHIPTSLRAALLACFSLVAPLVQTVSTGAFVGGVITCSLLAPQVQAEVADSYSESLSVEASSSGSDSSTTQTNIIIYDSYTDDNGDTVTGYYLGYDGVATEDLVLTTAKGYYQISGTGTYDMSNVDITASAEVNVLADSTGSTDYSFGALTVNSGARIYLYFACSDSVESGYMSFETLTGSGYVDATLSHSSYSVDNEGTGDYVVNFDHILDYTSTLATRTGKSWGGKFSGGTIININKVTVTESGKTTTITGPYTTSGGLTFFGAGNLTIAVLNYSGDTLEMLNEGNLSIASLAINDDITLTYTGAYADLNVASVELSGTGDVSVDLSGLELDDSTTYVDLGLVYDGDLSVVNGVDGWELTQNSTSLAWVYASGSAYVPTNLADSLAESLELGSTNVIIIYDAYTDDDGEMVVDNYIGYNSVATSNLIYTTTGLSSHIVGAGIQDLTNVDQTVNEDVIAQLAGDYLAPSYLSFGALTVKSGGTLYIFFAADVEAITSGSMSFESLTGEGNVAVTLNSDKGYNTDKKGTGEYFVTIDHIEDFTGTLSTRVGEGETSKYGGGSLLYISKVTVTDAAATTTIIGPYNYCENLDFSGAGSLVIESLNYTGDTLSMMNVGALSIGVDGDVDEDGISGFKFSSNLTLDYGDGSGQLADIVFDGTADLYLDLSDLDAAVMASYKETGFDLGVVDYTGGEITASRLDLYGWSLDQETWTLVYTDSEENLVWGEGVTSLSGDDYADAVVLFEEGTGASSVQISSDVEAAGLDISGSYSFIATSDTDSMAAGSIVVNSGSTLLDVDTTATSIEVKTGASMSVDEELTTGSLVVDGKFTNNGTSKVTDALEAGEDSIITNSAGATLSTGAGSTFDSLVNNGTVNLGAGAIIDTVTGDASITLSGVGNSITHYESTAGLNVAAGVEVEIGNYNSSDLTVGSGATVSFTGETTLNGELTNAGTIKAEGVELVLNTDTLSGGHIIAGSLTINTSASFDEITAGTLTLNTAASITKLAASEIFLYAVAVNDTTSALALDAGSDLLTVGSLEFSSGSLVLDISNAVDNQFLIDNNVAEGTSFTLIESAGDSSLLDSSLDSADISLNQASADAMATYASDKMLSYSISVEDNDLVLSFFALEGGTVNLSYGMYTVEGETMYIFEKDAAGYTDTLTSYSVLDEADSIAVDVDKTLSLDGVSLGEGEDRDVELNNVTGKNNTLGLVGNDTEDSFTFVYDEGVEESLAGLAISNATVKMNEQMTITNSLTMDEGSVVVGTAVLEGATADLAGDVSNLVLQATESTINVGDVTEGALALGKGSSLDNCSINLTINSEDLSAGDTIVLFDAESLSLTGDDTIITITDIGDGDDWSKLANYLSLEIYEGSTDDYSNLNIVLDGGIAYYLCLVYDSETSSYLFQSDKLNYASVAQTENGKAGLNLLDSSYEYIRNLELNDEDTGDLGKVTVTLDGYIAEGNSAAADKLGAAVAGATTTSLGSALMSDVGRQLGSIRNRTRAMGVNPSVVNEDMPYYNAWVSAEGGSSDLDADGTAAGHKLNSVGGSVGVEADINDKLSVGVAYSYLLGDLTADGADNADGDMDSMYGSVYARINSKRWTHSMVATFGSIDASLDRTVSIDNDNSYKTKGDTDGSAFGLMYEVGYTYAVDEDSSTCIQPVFNVSYVNSSMDGYTETGSNAALHVGDQDNKYLSFGLGAVLETVVGEDMYNRSSILNARLMLKADAGDRQSEADVSLVNNAGVSQTIAGAEVGAVGVEMGVGITIPVTDDVGAIFADASCELRSGMTEVSGSVGYRFSF